MTEKLIIMFTKHLNTRSFFLVVISLMSVCEIQAEPIKPSMQLQKETLVALPVLSWLVLEESTLQSVRIDLASQLGSKGIVNEGQSAHTGGHLLNIAQVHGDGLFGEPNLRLASLNFDRDRRLSLVFFMVQRGWKDQNIESLIQRISNRYSGYASPILVEDGRGEAADRYVIFNLERFVVEIAVPQNGKFTQVTFSTLDLYKQIKNAEGTADLLLKALFDGGVPLP